MDRRTHTYLPWNAPQDKPPSKLWQHPWPFDQNQVVGLCYPSSSQSFLKCHWPSCQPSLCDHRHLGRLSGLLGLRFLLIVRKGINQQWEEGHKWQKCREKGVILRTNATAELSGMLKRTSGLDIVILAQHVFGPHDEVPDVVEGWVGLWRTGLPLGVLGDCTIWWLIILKANSPRKADYSIKSWRRTLTARSCSAVGGTAAMVRNHVWIVLRLWIWLNGMYFKVRVRLGRLRVPVLRLNKIGPSELSLSGFTVFLQCDVRAKLAGTWGW